MKLKILYVAPYYPFSNRSGSALRASNIIRELSRHHEIHVLCLHCQSAGQVPPDDVKDRCATVEIVRHRPRRWFGTLRSLVTLRPYDLAIHHNPEFKRRVASAINELKPNLVYFSRFAGAQYAVWDSGPVQVADQHDLSSAFWSIAATGAEKAWVRLFAFYNRQIVPSYERRIYSRFDGVICVSRSEHMATLGLISPNTKTLILPNGADIEHYTSEVDAPTAMTVVLTGAMNALRNVDAAVVFARQIFPQLKTRFPALRFQIVGHSPAKEVLDLRNIAGVEVTGEVADVRPFLQAAAVVVAPYWSGSGVKHKVPMAMAMAKAIVLTPNAAQGIDIEDGTHALLADSPHEFATAVERLLADSALGRRLGKNARQLVTMNYSWKSLASTLDSWLQELVAARKPATDSTA